MKSAPGTTYHLDVAGGSIEVKEDKGKVDDDSSMLLIPKYSNKLINAPEAWEVAIVKESVRSAVVSEPSTICACAKCGSTSYYRTLYEITHHKTWNYDGPPWVQNVGNSARWTNVKAKKKENWANFKQTNSSKSFALIRDPKERLLSAFKSKIGCHQSADANGQKSIVPRLLELAGFSPNIARSYIDKFNSSSPCLTLSEFIQVMFQIHSKGKDGVVNEHFRPQHLYCFLHAPPSAWSVVTTISASDAACKLESVILGRSSATREDCAMMKSHGTVGLEKYGSLTAVDEAMLDAITRDEYEVLRPYLVIV